MTGEVLRQQGNLMESSSTAVVVEIMLVTQKAMLVTQKAALTSSK